MGICWSLSISTTSRQRSVRRSAELRWVKAGP